jgi:hypothetical protein
MGELKIPLWVSRKPSKHQNTREGTLKRTKRGQTSEQQKKDKKSYPGNQAQSKGWQNE